MQPLATAGSPGLDASTGHMKLDGCMAELRSTISRRTLRRSCAGHAVQRHCSVLEGDVSMAKREASVQFSKKIDEAVQVDLGSSGETQLAEEEDENAKFQWRAEARKTNTEEINKTNGNH